MTTTDAPAAIGDLLRGWRERRRYSQLELSTAAGVSTRHLSFLENGRSRPSREMVLRLAEVLDVPLHARNTLLVAAGFAPQYPQHDLDAPALTPIRAAIDRVLAAHEPYPAIVVDRGWDIIAANASVGPLLEGVAPHLLEQPNAIRIALHPDGVAPRTRNLGQWRAHVLARLRSQVASSGDPRLAALLAEVTGYGSDLETPPHRLDAIAVPLQLATDAGDLSFISTIATFEHALDVTVADLSIEAFYPADDATRQALLGGSDA
jgi:transcriptional regulator with XRE-family HTH domain